jgi:phage terminase large subunit
MSTVHFKYLKWSKPLFEPKRYKGIKGGRASGKSHHFAQQIIDLMLENPDLNFVCLREIQKSLKFSAKKLIEDKIQEYDCGFAFDITLNEIRAKNGNGVIIFQGLQDHTADSIKSLEGFDYAWVEEAQSISKRSLELLTPTIRKEGSEVWFSWNPTYETDAIEQFFNRLNDDEKIVIKANYLNSIAILPETIIKEAERDRVNNPDDYGHIWLGEYITRSDAQIFKNRYKVEYFESDPRETHYYFGADWGFANDPNTLVRTHIAPHNVYGENCLYIEYDLNDRPYLHEDRKTSHTLDELPSFWDKIPLVRKNEVAADSARPETIRHMNDNGFTVKGAKKGQGSVEDGIEHLKGFDMIIIHPRCEDIIYEFTHYKYKIDKRSGQITNIIEDKFNHGIDALRYSQEDNMRKKAKIPTDIDLGGLGKSSVWV